MKSDTGRKRESLSVISDTKSYTDIILFLENANKSGDIYFEIPKNDSLQDYNTYYGNQILRILDSANASDIENYINDTVKEDDFFDYKEGDIFESIEKIYYLQKLGSANVENYNNDRIKEMVIDCVQNAYDEEGFFHYKDFDVYMTDMTEEDIMTVRLCHNMMTLYLCKEYDVIRMIDIQAIEQYITNSVAKNNSVVNNYYAYLCYNYLGKQTDRFNNIDITYDEREMDLIELNAYVSLMNELNAEIKNLQYIVDRMNAYVEECRIGNMMELFIAIDTLDKLEKPISKIEKDRIVSLLHMYQNENGTFPYISYYILDNKQLLMHYVMSFRMGLNPDIEKYGKLIIDNFEGQDSYDLYSYAYFVSEMHRDTTDLEKEIISQIKRSTLNDKTSIGYLLLAASELGINIKKSDYLSKEVISYIDLLSSSETKEYNIQDLILLYGALKSELIQINDIIIRATNNVDVEQMETMHALVLYYKYSILKYAEKNMHKTIVDEELFNEDLLKLRCNGGFKMNVEDSFIDLQATYYLINIIP